MIDQQAIHSKKEARYVMNSIFSFVIQFFTEDTSTTHIKLPVLILTLALLIVALLINIIISKKNSLYSNPKGKEVITELLQRNEVA